MTFEDDLLALERRVLEGAGGDFFRAVADLRRMLAADTGGAARRLEELALPALEEAASQGTLDGWTLGGQRAVTAAETALRVDPNTLGDADMRLLTPPTHLTDPFTGLDTLLADAKRRAVALLRSGADEATAAAPVFQAATTARSRIVTQVNAASNLAALEVGDATRSPMVWEAERDACVYCLALAGEVVEQAGDLFPPADLYAPTPSSMTTTSTPPLHPHCRCRLAILVSRDYADALKREAQRSILRGHSLASESQAVRVRAAARLLERDPVAPKTVKAFAAAAVKRGHFPTRDVPEGDPRLIIERAGPSSSSRPPEPSNPPEGPADIGTRISRATSTAEVVDHLRDHLPKTELIGWNDKTTVESAKQIVTTIAALVDKYPKVNLEQLRLEPLKPGVLAHAAGVFTRGVRKIRGVHIVVNSRHLSDDAARADFVRPSIAHGFFHPHEAEQSLAYTVTHEFGHTLDYTSDKKTRRQIASIQTRYAKESGIAKDSPLWALNLSGYGRKDSGEAIAEAFADVEINGDKAKGLSKAIHAVLIKNLEEA